VLQSTTTASQITVKRMSSMTSSGGERTPRQRLSRNASDVSDLSTTTPLTPLVKSRPRRVRQRHDDDSSSCSSTEAISQSVEDMWCENPLYATQQQGRHRHSPSKPRRRVANKSQTVDTGPLDDLLVQTAAERDKYVSRSNAELHLSSAATVSSLATVAPPAPLSLRSATFRSEPDVAMTVTSVTDEDTIVDTGRGTMIDCISVEAPDDTLIKPSRLRASMNSRHRRLPASAASADDLSLASTPSGGGVTVRRVGSLRDVPPGNGVSTGDSGSSPGGFQRGLWKTASLREGKPLQLRQDNGSQEVVQRTGDTAVVKDVMSQSNTAAITTSNSSAQTVVLQGSALRTTSTGSSTSPVSAGNQFTFAVPADVLRRRTTASQGLDVLPSFNRNVGYATNNHGTSSATAPDSQPKREHVNSSSAANGAVSYEQLLRDYQQVS
jgi:hypothetical protein